MSISVDCSSHSRNHAVHRLPRPGKEFNTVYENYQELERRCYSYKHQRGFYRKRVRFSVRLDFLISDFSFFASLYNLTSLAYVEGEPFGYYYHGVIVVNAASDAKSLADLKSKRACFPSFNGLGKAK